MRRRALTATTLAIAATVLIPSAAGAAVTRAPATLNFPSQQAGTTSATQTATVMATCEVFESGGGSPMCIVPGRFVPVGTFSGVNPADFAQTNNCGLGIISFTNTPATCTFSVTFNPTAPGFRTATLLLGNRGSPSFPEPLTVDLTGIAAPAPVQPTPAKKKCKKGKKLRKGKCVRKTTKKK